MEIIVAVQDKWPLGFGFRPTDEELVDYLQHKLLDEDCHVNIFPEIELCKVEPWEVPGLPMIKSDDPQRFFFNPVHYKYSNSTRVDRTTKRGFWKSTGKDRDIKVSGTNDVIWKKKTLVYYKGCVPNGVKSNWVIHEYRPDTFLENQKRFVLCHLKNQAGKGEIDASICDEGEPSTGRHIASSEHENVATEGGVPPVDVLPEMHMETIFQPMHKEEIDFPPMQQSPNSIEQGASPADNAYFKNEDSVMQTPSETAEEENQFSTSILVPKQQHPIIIEQETFFTSFPAHKAYSKNEDCNKQTPFKTTEEENEFSTSILALIQEPSIGIEQETFFENFLAHNAYFKNEDCNMQTSVETVEGGNESLTSISTFEITEEDKEFLNSFFVDGNFVPNEESRYVVFNNSTQPESLKRAHCESNDTDAKVASALYGNIVDTLAMCNEHPSSGEYHVSKMLKIHGMIDGGMHLVSSDQETYKEESIIQNDFWGVETSSCDSTTDKPLKADCVEISSSPSTLRRWKNKHHPRSSHFISQKNTARRSQIQKKASSDAISHLEAEKEMAIVELREDQKNTQNTTSGESLEIISHQSSSVKRMVLSSA